MPVKCYLPKKGQFQSDIVVEFNYEDRENPKHNYIKEYEQNPIVFKTPTKSKDITLPLGSIVRAYVSIKQPQQYIKLDSFEVINNQNDLEDSFADNLTSSVILSNATEHLWDSELLIPSLGDPFEHLLKELKGNDDKLSTKGNINKAFIIATWLFTYNNIPRGHRSDYLERKLGMNDKYLTQVMNRYSVKFSDIADKNLTKNIWKDEEFVFQNKSVYFVRHTEKETKGGYMPTWLVKELETFITDEYYKGVTPYQLPLEMTGATTSG
jgi:hypothetical protein